MRSIVVAYTIGCTFLISMKIRIFILLSLAFILTGCGKDDDGQDEGGPVVLNRNANVVTTQPEVARLEFPRLKGGDNNLIVIHKTKDKYDPDGVNYSIEWDCEKKSQRWSCFQLHKYGGSQTSRQNTWGEDPDIPSYARFADSYRMFTGSGFTRGHICASADRLYSVTANQQTFYYSNMQPQYYNFNGGNNYTGIWVRMENQVRSWAATSGYDTLYVCKGGTIDKEEQILMRIEKTFTTDKMIVPKYFFMALLCKNAQGYKALAFWVEHRPEPYTGTENLSDYVVNIRQLEALTGIDFFCNLPDDVENSVENLNVENIKRAWGLK